MECKGRHNLLDGYALVRGSEPTVIALATRAGETVLTLTLLKPWKNTSLSVKRNQVCLRQPKFVKQQLPAVTIIGTPAVTAAETALSKAVLAPPPRAKTPMDGRPEVCLRVTTQLTPEIISATDPVPESESTLTAMPLAAVAVPPVDAHSA